MDVPSLPNCLDRVHALDGHVARGQRAAHRARLSHAIAEASDAIESASGEALATARVTLVRAHAARAEDALHDAGQLSMSAQRAPTANACDEGWRRVEAIVAGAEKSARVAGAILAELEAIEAVAAAEGDRSALKAVRLARAAAARADDAARKARGIVDARNHGRVQAYYSRIASRHSSCRRIRSSSRRFATSSAST